MFHIKKKLLLVIEYTLLNVFILELKVYCGSDKFYGRSKFGQYDKEKNRAPLYYLSQLYFPLFNKITEGLKEPCHK